MHRVTGSGIVGGRRRRLEGTALRRYRLALLIPILALVLQACGTRLPNSAFVKAQQGSNAGSTGLAAGDEGGTDQSTTGATGDQAAAGGGAAGGAAGTAGGAAAGKGGGAAGG